MRFLPVLVLLAVGCGLADADLDGVTADLDCNDFDNLVFPGADERCDGLDNDCNGIADDDYATGGFVFYADGDGDGFGATAGTAVACAAPEGFVASADDCDDRNDGINPRAVELCDGVDQDCNGRIDESAIDAPVWHADYDQDGFGSEAVVRRECEAPPGYIADGADCNDFRGDVNPAGTERCDFVDNDCDRQVDEPDAEDARDFFLDQDDDGFGDATMPTRACFLPDGHAETPTDCNDLNPAMAPDLMEVCRDGLDNNCNGLPDQCSVSSWGDVTDASTSWSGLDTRGYLGNDVKIVGDLNNDGFDDMVGGAWYETVGGSLAAGRAWIIYGSESMGSDPGPIDLDDEPSITGVTRFGYAGRAVSGAGDIDGDGYDDMIIGAYGENSRRGDVYIVHGGPDKIGGAVSGSTLPTLGGTISSGSLGISLTGGFDLDGDGLSDMALGAEGASSWRGNVYLVYGNADRLSGKVNVDDRAGAILQGPSTSAYLGGESTMGRGGDFDGDGYHDLAVGAWRATGRASWSGAAWVVYGEASRLSGTITVSDLPDVVQGEASFNYLGTGTGSVGDLNGDGYEDLGIGCYGCGGYNGHLSVFFGGAGRIGASVGSDADLTLVGDSRAYLGRYAPVSGDFDNDGIDDVAVGAHFASMAGRTYQGAVYVLRGDAALAGEISAADGDFDAVIQGPPAAFQYFGRGLGAGDVNGDGIMDLLAGSERAGSNRGLMYLFQGTSL